MTWTEGVPGASSLSHSPVAVQGPLVKSQSDLRRGLWETRTQQASLCLAAAGSSGPSQGME